jgi:hypothetical protein
MAVHPNTLGTMGTSLVEGQLVTSQGLSACFSWIPFGQGEHCCFKPRTYPSANESRGIFQSRCSESGPKPLSIYVVRDFLAESIRRSWCYNQDVGLFFKFPSRNIGTASHRDFFWAVSVAACLKVGSRYLRKNHSCASRPGK